MTGPPRALGGQQGQWSDLGMSGPLGEPRVMRGRLTVVGALRSALSPVRSPFLATAISSPVRQVIGVR
jgi:hypothetical protein